MKLGIKELCHVAISCRSMEKSLAFYTNVFGFQINDALGSNNGNIKLDIGNRTYIELFPFSMYESYGRGCIAHFAIEVECVSTIIVHLSRNGFQPLRGPFEVKCAGSDRVIRKLVFYAGPDGEEIELIESINS